MIGLSKCPGFRNNCPAMKLQDGELNIHANSMPSIIVTASQKVLINNAKIDKSYI